MSYTIIDCEQRTPEWFAARAGRLTGSCAADMLATRKDGKEAAPRAQLRARLVCERLTGIPAEEQYVGRFAERGTDLESAAVAAYEAETGRIVRRSGFFAHDEWLIGCSLDGHVGEPLEGIIEAKCPKPETHLAYVKAGIAPTEYQPQILHNLWVTDAPWCDFVSFDDRFQEERLRLFIVRVLRDDFAIVNYKKSALAFLAEVERDVQAVRTCANPASVLASFGPAFEDAPTRESLAGRT